MEPVSTDVPRRFVSLRLALGFLLVLAVYGLVVADPLLAFSFPINPWDWTLYVVLCLLAFLLVFASCFFTFQFRRKEVVIFVAIGAIVCLSSSRLGGALLRTPTSWLYATGFRIHAWPLEQYLSQCRLVRFLENDVEQTVGRCETREWLGGAMSTTVIYDPTGEILKPVNHRTQAWQAAMSEFYSDRILNSSEKRTVRIFGDFYAVDTFESEDSG